MKLTFIILATCFGWFNTKIKEETIKHSAPAEGEYVRIWHDGKLYTAKPDQRLAKTFNSAQSYVQGQVTDGATSDYFSFYLLVKAASTGTFPFGDVAQKRSTARFVFSSSTIGYASDYTPCGGNKEKIYAKGYIVITKQPQKKGDYLEGYVAAEPSNKEPFTAYYLDFCKLKEGAIKAEFRLRKDF